MIGKSKGLTIVESKHWRQGDRIACICIPAGDTNLKLNAIYRVNFVSHDVVCIREFQYCTFPVSLFRRLVCDCEIGEEFCEHCDPEKNPLKKKADIEAFKPPVKILAKDWTTGDVILCVEDVFMGDSGRHAFVKGNTYAIYKRKEGFLSTKNAFNEDHFLGREEWSDRHFVLQHRPSSVAIVEENPLKKKADELANPFPLAINQSVEKKPDTRTADQKLADDIQHQQTTIEQGISMAVDAILALSFIDKRLSDEAAARCKAEVDIVVKIINQRRADRASGLPRKHFQPMMGSF